MTDLTHNPDHYPHNGGNADTDLLCRACELGVPVKRAMPGPPETMPPVHDLSRPPVGPDGQFDWDTWRRWKEQDEREWRAIQAKRLTVAECAAEYWRAEADALRSHPAVESWSARPIDTICREHVWHRFATTPHALEVEA